MWVLAKGDRRAALTARTYPSWIELRVCVDGSLIFSEFVRPFDGKDPSAVAEQHRAAFLERGWDCGRVGAP